MYPGRYIIDVRGFLYLFFKVFEIYSLAEIILYCMFLIRNFRKVIDAEFIFSIKCFMF